MQEYPGNIHSTAADLLHEMKDNHVLTGIVRCSIRACLNSAFCEK